MGLEKHTYNEILQTMVQTFEEKSGQVVEDFGDVHLKMQTLAGELFGLDNAVHWLHSQMFVATATGQELDKHAGERGLARKKASVAVGELTFFVGTLLDVDMTIPVGTLCALSSGTQQYETTLSGVLPAGSMSITLPTASTVAGKEGNCGRGAVVVPVTVPSGIETVTNEGPFSGGSNEESDNNLRVRIVDTWQKRTNGINKDLYRDFVLSYEDVLKVAVLPFIGGENTFTIYVALKDNIENENLLKQIKKDITEKMQTLTDVSVLHAENESLNVAVDMQIHKGSSFESLSEKVQEAVQEFLYELPIGETVYHSKLSSVVMGVDGVKDCKILAPDDECVLPANTHVVYANVNVFEVVHA